MAWWSEVDGGSHGDVLNECLCAVGEGEPANMDLCAVGRAMATAMSRVSAITRTSHHIQSFLVPSLTGNRTVTH